MAMLMAMALLMAGCEKKTRARAQSGTDFTLKTPDGTEVSLASKKGKVVLIEFWATWCPPCRTSMPELAKLHESMKGKDFEILAISLDESVSDVKKFVEDNAIPFTVLMDDGEVSDRYGVINIPVTFILDKEGKVAKKHLGYAPGVTESLIKEIVELL